MDSNDLNQIDLAIAIKTNQMQRDLKSITENHVRETLLGTVWKFQRPHNVAKAVDDVFRITVSEIVAFLSSQAIIQGSMMSENDIEKLIK